MLGGIDHKRCGHNVIDVACYHQMRFVFVCVKPCVIVCPVCLMQLTVHVATPHHKGGSSAHAASNQRQVAARMDAVKDSFRWLTVAFCTACGVYN